jgi:hypothetical protein
MKEIVMVGRIDDLGKVVLHKEIRRTVRKGNAVTSELVVTY